MKHRNALFAGLALVAATSAAPVLQVLLKPDALNVVASRIAGTWSLEPNLTKRLDPDHPTGSMATIAFYDNPAVLNDLLAASDRFSRSQVFASGNVSIDGTVHLYVLINENGNMKVVWFSPTTTSPIGRNESKTLQVAVARDRAQDILILGGDTKGESSAAFVRAP